MFLNRKSFFGIVKLCLYFLVSSIYNSNVFASTNVIVSLNQKDTTVNPVNLPYPITDRRGDDLSTSSHNIFDKFKPNNQSDSVVFDYETKRYVIYEKIGNRYYRTPMTYSFEEYWDLKYRKA